MAALTTVTPASKRYPQREGTELEWHGTLTGPASYTTGGDTLSPLLLGMTKIDGGLVGGATSGRMFQLIPQADGTAKLKAYAVGGAEVANATNISADTPFAVIIGH
jgi:hypothetical protein